LKPSGINERMQLRRGGKLTMLRQIATELGMLAMILIEITIIGAILQFMVYEIRKLLWK
jgi:hypothetical protein